MSENRREMEEEAGKSIGMFFKCAVARKEFFDRKRKSVRDVGTVYSDVVDQPFEL